MIFSFLFIINYNYVHLTDGQYNKYRLILLHTCHKIILIVGENSPTFPIAADLRPLRPGRFFKKWYIKWSPTSSTRSFIFHIDQEITTLTSLTWTIIIKTSIPKTAFKLLRHCRLFFSNVPQNFPKWSIIFKTLNRIVGEVFSNTVF